MALARFVPIVVLFACGGGSGGPPSGDDAGEPAPDASAGADAGGDGDGDGDAGEPPLVFCEEPTTLLYDPPASRDTLPDDVFTRDDPSTVTGLRVSFAAAQDTRDAVEVPW